MVLNLINLLLKRYWKSVENDFLKCVGTLSIKYSVDFCYLLSLLVIRNFSGACSSFEVLKGYMARERLGTPGLDRTVINTKNTLNTTFFFQF